MSRPGGRASCPAPGVVELVEHGKPGVALVALSSRRMGLHDSVCGRLIVRPHERGKTRPEAGLSVSATGCRGVPPLAPFTGR